jgi:hypothetical protein
MEKSYATSASERPPSEGVANPNPHVPENATVDGNGTAVGEGAIHVEEGVVAGGVVGGDVSEVKSRKSGSDRFLLATFALALVSFFPSQYVR